MNSMAVIDEYIEYFLYNDRGISGTTGTGGIKIAPDTVAFCASGQIDQNKNMVLSYLHKAIKPTNQLRMIEDAVVIYRIARAPERRIFKIDVGNLPKVKAEQYLRDVMARYRNKLVYDANTGEIRDDRNYMSMLEDFWLPSREGGRGTDITTLPGGQNLGEITDIEMASNILYRYTTPLGVASVTETIVGSTENGTIYYTPTVNVVLNRLTKEDQNEIKLLGQTKVVIFAQLNEKLANGHDVIIGLGVTNGMSLNAGTMDSGACLLYTSDAADE